MEQYNKSLTSYIKLKLEGLNLERFLLFLKQNNVTLFNVYKQDFKTLVFTMTADDYKKILKLKGFRSYKITELNKKGLIFFLKSIQLKVGLLLGLMVAIAAFSFFSMFTFNINISGNKIIKNNDIVLELSKNNIKIGKINYFNNNDIELILKNKFNDISLVSVIKKGTNIIINIKEKEKLNEVNQEFIYAPANLIIKSLIINKGTALKKVGDIVKKGDAIVAPYIINNEGQKDPCAPNASLTAEAWYFGQVEFETKEIEKVKTGKKVVTSSYFNIFNNNFFSITKKHNFKSFNEVVSECYISNFFLPLKFHKVVVYELKDKITMHDFEKSKNELITKSKTLAYKSFPSNLIVEEESLVISQINTKYIVQTVLKTTISNTYS